MKIVRSAPNISLWYQLEDAVDKKPGRYFTLIGCSDIFLALAQRIQQAPSLQHCVITVNLQH